MPSLHKALTPNRLVLKRYLKNRPAVWALAYLAMVHLMAIFAFLISPDKTPNANDGAVQIQKEAPLFRVTVLKTRKNMVLPEGNILSQLIAGKESAYTLEPLATAPFIQGDSVYFEEYGVHGQRRSLLLLDCVVPLFVGESDLLGEAAMGNHLAEGDTWRYVDVTGNEQSISKSALKSQFLKENLEERFYLMGTDKAGRDIFSRLVQGARISLSIGLVATLISFTVGLFFGALAGFFGGKVDMAVHWLMTVIWSIPAIMLVIAISLALQNKGIWVVFVAVGLTMWVEIARVIRGQIMSVKQQQFIEAARALGYSDLRIIFKHIFPNILGPVLVICSANFASAILVEAGLSFLGLGVQPPMPSWGAMVNEGFRAMGTQDSWHLILLPAFSISFTVLAFNLVGNGLRDAFDPTLVARRG